MDRCEEHGLYLYSNGLDNCNNMIMTCKLGCMERKKINRFPNVDYVKSEIIKSEVLVCEHCDGIVYVCDKCFDYFCEGKDMLCDEHGEHFHEQCKPE